jgi:carboxymethylenebutenolidase
MESLGTVSGHLRRPSGAGPWPALIVIQEWWGLDEQTRSIADRFANEGYLAFAPDLYHGELAELGDHENAAVLVEKYGTSAPQDLERVFDALQQHSACDRHIGSVGFCFGGRMSLTLGLTRHLDAICTFYGGGMQRIFDRLDELQSPVLGLFGDADQSIPPGTVAEFGSILERLGLEHEIVVYPGSGHAFFRDRDASVYRPMAAADAWIRATAFFAKHLKSASA